MNLHTTNIYFISNTGDKNVMVCHTKVKLSSSYKGYDLVVELSIFGWIKIHHYFVRLWQYILGIHFVVLLLIWFLVYLSGLCPSMACSNIMGGSVTTPRSGNIAFSLHNYMIVIKTRLLFPLHIQLFHTPPLIYEPYYLLFSPAYGRQEYWPPLLCHRKVKYLPPGNLLWHTDVLFGDILPNRLHPFVHYRLTNRGGYSHHPLLNQNTQI